MKQEEEAKNAKEEPHPMFRDLRLLPSFSGHLACRVIWQAVHCLSGIPTCQGANIGQCDLLSSVEMKSTVAIEKTQPPRECRQLGKLSLSVQFRGPFRVSLPSVCTPTLLEKCHVILFHR